MDKDNGETIDKSVEARIKRLEKENQRLREALEEIAKERRTMTVGDDSFEVDTRILSASFSMKIAQQALEQTE